MSSSVGATLYVAFSVICVSVLKVFNEIVTEPYMASICALFWADEY